MKWEYIIVNWVEESGKIGGLCGLNHLASILNRFGEDGWEAVCLYNHSVNQTSLPLEVLFKRQVDEDKQKFAKETPSQNVDPTAETKR